MASDDMIDYEGHDGMTGEDRRKMIEGQDPSLVRKYLAAQKRASTLEKNLLDTYGGVPDVNESRAMFISILIDILVPIGSPERLQAETEYCLRMAERLASAEERLKEITAEAEKQAAEQRNSLTRVQKQLILPGQAG